MVATFQVPVPQKLNEDPETAEYFRALQLFINDLVAPEGALAVGEATAETTAEQAVTLEEQQAALVVVAAQTDDNTTNLSVIQSGTPIYAIAGDSTLRSMDANAAAGTISVNPTQSEVENLRDAQLVSDDVLATLIRDLGVKGIVG
ncbi:unnamed protein product [marine sediment metagenome]|uniref:Uncharacterized protein n=1 Tax=marine sediment metagenome TaxID=412755 RepID=X0TGX7_9ZZZZ